MRKTLLFFPLYFSLLTTKAQISPMLFYTSPGVVGPHVGMLESKHDLKGSIMTMKEFQITEGKKHLIRYLKLNAAGKIAECGDSTIKIVNSYDKSLRLNKLICYHRGTADCSETYAYDINGNLISRVTNDVSGTVFYDTLRYTAGTRIAEETQWRVDGRIKTKIFHTEYVYDDHQRLISITGKHFRKSLPGHGPKDTSLEFSLTMAESNNELIEIRDNNKPEEFPPVYYLNGDMLFVQKYEYGENGDIAKDITVSDETDYTYNNKRELISILRYDSVKRLIEKKIFEYLDGFRLKETVYAKAEQADSLYKDSLIEFNKLGKVIRAVEYWPGGLWSNKTTYSYNAKGIKTREISNSRRSEDDTSWYNLNTDTIKYNSIGNVVEDIAGKNDATCHDRKEKTLTTYDIYGNWIKIYSKTVSGIGGGNYIQSEAGNYRTISYYSEIKTTKPQQKTVREYTNHPGKSKSRALD